MLKPNVKAHRAATHLTSLPLQEASDGFSTGSHEDDPFAAEDAPAPAAVAAAPAPPSEDSQLSEQLEAALGSPPGGAAADAWAASAAGRLRGAAGAASDTSADSPGGGLPGGGADVGDDDEVEYSEADLGVAAPQIPAAHSGDRESVPSAGSGGSDRWQSPSVPPPSQQQQQLWHAAAGAAAPRDALPQEQSSEGFEEDEIEHEEELAEEAGGAQSNAAAEVEGRGHFSAAADLLQYQPQQPPQHAQPLYQLTPQHNQQQHVTRRTSSSASLGSSLSCRGHSAHATQQQPASAHPLAQLPIAAEQRPATASSSRRSSLQQQGSQHHARASSGNGSVAGSNGGGSSRGGGHERSKSLSRASSAAASEADLLRAAHGAIGGGRPMSAKDSDRQLLAASSPQGRGAAAGAAGHAGRSAAAAVPSRGGGSTTREAAATTAVAFAGSARSDSRASVVGGCGDDADVVPPDHWGGEPTSCMLGIQLCG